MKTFTIICVGAALYSSQAAAQESSPSTIEANGAAPIAVANSVEPEVALEELIRRALENNPQSAIARANFQAAQARRESLGSLPNPILQVIPGIGGNRESRDEEILLSQPLDIFGQRRALRGVATAETRRAQAESVLTSRLLVYEVKRAAAHLYAAQEAESLGAAQVDIARAFRDAATRKAQLGETPPVQTQRAQLELDRIQVELEQVRAERIIRRFVLNQLIGAPPEALLKVALPNADFSTTTTTEIASEPVASERVNFDLGAQRTQLLPGALQRPDILRAQAAVEVARAQAQAIGRQRKPQVELQVRRGGAFDSAPTSLRAVVTAPLFDFGSIKGEKRAADFEAAAREEQVKLLRSQATAQVEAALIRQGQSQTTVIKYRDSLVPQSLDLLRKTQVGYTAGASTFLEVLEAQRATRQIQSEYVQALVGAANAESALELALSGGSLGEDFLGESSLTTAGVATISPMNQGLRP